jgi:haloalkane dehalogenase
MTVMADQGFDIDPIDRLRRERVAVLDSEMSYVDVGSGEPVVFLHGNPTSAYLWRNIIPYAAASNRCLAPDLIGMGASGKPRSHAYRFVDHARYLDAWFEAVGLTGPVTLVGHDWGGALAFHRARRLPQTISALAYMETFVEPRRWDDLTPAARDFIVRVRSPEGDQMMLERNAFVEIGLPNNVLRTLGDPEMAAYRTPYPDRDSRLPTLVWPREQPVGGSPEDVVEIVTRYGEWLQQSEHSKLFINAEPGNLITGRALAFCRTFPNQRETTVKGIHFIQEDAPHEIGTALRDFLGSLER